MDSGRALCIRYGSRRDCALPERSQRGSEARTDSFVLDADSGYCGKVFRQIVGAGRRKAADGRERRGIESDGRQPFAGRCVPEIARPGERSMRLYSRGLVGRLRKAVKNQRKLLNIKDK